MHSEIPVSVENVINHLGIRSDQLIGKGGEGYVFDHSEDTVVKVYLKASKKYLEQLMALQQRAVRAQLPYGTPQILRIESHDGVLYTTERKLAGKQLDTVFPELSPEQQQQVLRNLVDALEPLATIDVSDLPFGQIVLSTESVQAKSWSEYVLQKLDQQLEKSQQYLRIDVRDYELWVALLRQKLSKIHIPSMHKQFVHTDYYLNNVLVSKQLDISAVLDVSIHSVAGDHRLDLASICFLTLDPHITQEHVEYVRSYVIQKHGKEIAPLLDMYALYYAFYYAELHDFDPHSYKWCLPTFAPISQIFFPLEGAS